MKMDVNPIYDASNHVEEKVKKRIEFSKGSGDYLIWKGKIKP